MILWPEEGLSESTKSQRELKPSKKTSKLDEEGSSIEVVNPLRRGGGPWRVTCRLLATRMGRGDRAPSSYPVLRGSLPPLAG